MRPRPQTAARRVGDAGELRAVQHLRSQGWRIVARNWRHGRDEIDVVAQDGANLVFVEVKTRTATGAVDDTGSGYFAVNTRKRHALARACRAYMEGLSRPPQHFRFDIIEVKLHPADASEVLHHRGIPLFTAHAHFKAGRHR
jgi:putative endonuclease